MVQTRHRSRRWIKTVGGELDTILVSRPEVAEDVIPAIRRHCRVRIVYYGHDLHFRRMRQQAEVMHDDRLLRLAEHMRQREYAIWRQADLSLYLSEEEAQIASALQPDAKIGSVVPYCFDTFAAPRAAPPRHDIIFVAGFAHPPNEDAALWFVAEILPLIRADVPTVHLSIIGSNPTGTGARRWPGTVSPSWPTSAMRTSRRRTIAPVSRWCRCVTAPA